MNVEYYMNKGILTLLIQSRDEAKKEYKKACNILKPCEEKYFASENAIKEEFVKQKLYIPIDKLPEYIGDKEMSSITVVYENGKTERLNHPYNISYETTKWAKGGYTPGRRLTSGASDDGYSFERDIDEDHIVGFYDLKLENNVEVKETYMKEIIRKFLAET